MIVQAIKTKYLSPTNYRGGRIKAKAWGGNITIPYPHQMNTDQAHRKAAMALVDKMGWGGLWAQGGSADGSGYYFVCVGKELS